MHKKMSVRAENNKTAMCNVINKLGRMKRQRIISFQSIIRVHVVASEAVFVLHSFLGRGTEECLLYNLHPLTK